VDQLCTLDGGGRWNGVGTGEGGRERREEVDEGGESVERHKSRRAVRKRSASLTGGDGRRGGR